MKEHKCKKMDFESLRIYKYLTLWSLSIKVYWDSHPIEYHIKYCPFCGDELK